MGDEELVVALWAIADMIPGDRAKDAAYVIGKGARAVGARGGEHVFEREQTGTRSTSRMAGKSREWRQLIRQNWPAAGQPGGGAPTGGPTPRPNGIRATNELAEPLGRLGAV